MCIWVSFGTSADFLWRPRLYPLELDGGSLESCGHERGSEGLLFAFCITSFYLLSGYHFWLWFSRENAWAQRRDLGPFPWQWSWDEGHTPEYRRQNTQGVCGEGLPGNQECSQLFIYPRLRLLGSAFTGGIGAFLCIGMKKVFFF